MADPIVEIRNGKIRGALDQSVYSFKGIPYGGPTSGAGRFKPPVPAAPWTEVRDALSYGPSCPQPGGPVLNMTPEISAVFDRDETPPQNENCLYLNVWTAGLNDGGHRPVMVWIHGGAFFVGSGSGKLYAGDALVRKGDVVVVTVNHRLGPLGYLHLGDLAGEEFAASGNVGMLDLILALEWVRDNIALFGGDPHNVTLFGESGGGAKISVLLAMPAAQGLFHKAVIQSGPGLYMHDREAATATARQLLNRINLNPQRMAEIQQAPVERLLAAQAAAARRDGFFMLKPVVDGTLLPHRPFDPIAPAISAHIPLLIGTTKDEMNLFLGKVPLLGTFGGPRWPGQIALEISSRAVLGPEAGPRVLQTYRYTRPQAAPHEIFCAVVTDWAIRIGSIRIAERKAAAGSAPVYMYLFGWESPYLNGRLKSHHALEIPFVFNHINVTPSMTGRRPECYPLAEKMSAAWIAFARSGNPNHPDLPFWPAYTLKERATMLFNTDCRVQNDPDREERLAWTGLKLQAM